MVHDLAMILIGVLIAVIAYLIWYWRASKEVVTISQEVIADASKAGSAIHGAEQAASVAAKDLKAL